MLRSRLKQEIANDGFARTSIKKRLIEKLVVEICSLVTLTDEGSFEVGCCVSGLPPLLC